MSDDSRLVQELRDQLQAMADENQGLRVQIAHRDRWIGELRATVAAFMGAPLQEPIRVSENLRRRR